jgi:hypothetical protein
MRIPFVTTVTCCEYGLNQLQNELEDSSESGWKTCWAGNAQSVHMFARAVSMFLNKKLICITIQRFVLRIQR